MLKIMSVNAGSSSLKFKLFEMPAETVITEGIIERIGMQDAGVTFKYNGEKKSKVLPIKNHEEAVKILLDLLIKQNIVTSLDEINGVGHRVLHGGEVYAKSVVFDDDVERVVDEMKVLGPLHNPHNLTGYRAFKAALPNVGNVAIFDTAFHQTMPADRYMYPIPYDYYKQFGIRRYGFHGTSHLYVSGRCIELLGNPAHSNIITAHIGNGASLAAVRDGKCENTSMGLTPLAGVEMGTRSGDIDPAVVTFLSEKLHVSAEEVISILNKKSGLLGVSGVSSDSRDICKAIEEGNERALLARKIQVETVVNYVGQYYVELGHVDALVFTAGIGENDTIFRAEVCKMLEEPLGIKIDLELNKARGKEVMISTPESKIKVYVIPTDEELVIARDTVKLLKLI